MAQFPLLGTLDDESPRPRLVTDINLCVFAGTAISGTVTHDTPGSSIATTSATAALTNDEVVIVAANRSTCAARSPLNGVESV